MRTFRWMLLAIAIIASTLPAQAFHEEFSEIASASLGNGGWVRYELLAEEGAGIGYEIRGSTTDTESVSIAEWIIEEGGRSAGLSTSSAAPGTRVSTFPTGTIVETWSGPSESGGFGTGAGILGLSEGPVTVIVGVVAKNGSLEAEISLSGVDVTLLGSSSGDGTFQLDPEDFTSAAHVRAQFGLAETAAMAEASVVTDAPLFAWFVTHHDVTATRYEGPARKERSVSGTGFGWIILDGEPAGEHRFMVDAVAGAVFTGWKVVGIPATPI